ncbi:MAG: primosomal protein N' [Fidelibacterota bacterium]
MFADIAFPISSYRVFTYKVPPELMEQIQVGVRVTAPFGARKSQGIVVSVNKKSDFSGALKWIDSLVDDQPVLDTELWKLLQWLSEYYFTPLGQVARSALPAHLSTRYSPPTQSKVKLISPVIDPEAIKKRAKAQALVIKHLRQSKAYVPVSEFQSLVSNPLAVCRRLAEKGLVKLALEPLVPKLTDFAFKPIHKKIRFTDYQQVVINNIRIALKKQSFQPYLLHGVTGSGKTEIYIESALHALNQDQTVIILLPEIALTPQIAGRFMAVFGDQVALWHSKLTQAARAWTWKNICSGNYKVVIGARSAVFAPLKNLGLIIVDEEQEHSYKQEYPDPRYHAREVALMRGKIHGATVILASATPSLESYFNQVQSKFGYLHLPDRFGGSTYPLVHVVNMVQEAEETGFYGQGLSRMMIEKINQRLAVGEQVILLQNRRGYAPILKCEDCGTLEMCSNCQVTLTYHQVGQYLQCHFCGYTSQHLPDVCHACSSANLRLAGIGTQRVEESLKDAFPSARIERLDVDTAHSGIRISALLERFANGQIDILLGTQMVAKGLDFPNATLVGIINADTGLFLPDFRSGERVFQLIYQAAGRSGRGRKPGEVIVQTYNVDDIVIKCATQLDLKKYYNIALNERKELNYPPFSWIVKIELSNPSRKAVEKSAKQVKNYLTNPYKGLDILGPAYCYREKLRNRFRMQIVLKSSKVVDPDGKRIHRFLSKKLLDDENMKIHHSTRLNIDVNPVSLL